nr:MAG TPA: hypothetical protein [Caudoviricetes sp.]
MISLTLELPGEERFDEESSTFISMPPCTLHLTHSLYSVSLWESVYKRSFLDSPPNTPEETMYYVECMSEEPLPGDFMRRLDRNIQVKIAEYIADGASATHLLDPPARGGPKDSMTSELIYWYMSQFNIPYDCDKWNLNRLLTLIKLSAAKQGGSNASASATAAQRAAMNKARRARYNSKG